MQILQYTVAQIFGIQLLILLILPMIEGGVENTKESVFLGRLIAGACSMVLPIFFCELLNSFCSGL